MAISAPRAVPIPKRNKMGISSTPPPRPLTNKKIYSKSTECSGCGARQSVLKGSTLQCAYCGSEKDLVETTVVMPADSEIIMPAYPLNKPLPPPIRKVKS